MIWVFAEERSGSTWFCETLSVRLGKCFTYLEEFAPEHDHIHQTHNFSWLPRAGGVLLRMSRRDRVEHFMSVALMNSVSHTTWWHRPHVFRQHYIKDTAALEAAFDGPQLVVRQADVDAYFDLLRSRDEFWSEVQGQTIYYEDLYDGVMVDRLGVLMKFDANGVTVKLPYNKRDLIANWQEAETWVKERL